METLINMCVIIDDRYRGDVGWRQWSLCVCELERSRWRRRVCT